MACTVCKDLQSDPLVPSSQEGQALLSDIKTTADGGCKPCMVLLTGAKRLTSGSKYLLDQLLCSWEVAGPSNPLSLSVKSVWFEENGKPWYASMGSLDIYARSGFTLIVFLDSACSFVSAAETLKDDPTQSQLYPKIEEWLQRCSEHHVPRCEPNIVSTLPHRVLDVSSGQSGDRVSLYCSESGEQGTYIALSHCWGSNSHTPITTTLQNFASHRENIPWDDLPRTFRDAITITRNLKIRYLWIDSLCILQDDKNDWEIEAAAMGSIYTSARLVIAASAAPNSSHGCFPVPLTTSELESRIFLQDKELGTLYAREPLLHSSGWMMVDYDFPLATRGWTYQEWLLATRIVHFNPKEIILECRTETRCECGRSHEQSLLRASPEDRDQREVWRDIVENYSARKFTYYQDVLPALSSTASRMARSEWGSYIAGLWEADLPSCLLWHFELTPMQASSRPPVYTAPSFSWASFIGRISQSVSLRPSPSIYPQDLITILEVKCHLSSSNPFGTVSSGFLKLRGKLLMAAEISPGTTPQYPVTITILDRTSQQPLSPAKILQPPFVIRDIIEEAPKRHEPFYILPIQASPDHPEVRDGIPPYAALLLKRERSGEYFRLGMIELLAGHDISGVAEEVIVLV